MQKQNQTKSNEVVEFDLKPYIQPEEIDVVEYDLKPHIPVEPSGVVEFDLKPYLDKSSGETPQAEQKAEGSALTKVEGFSDIRLGNSDETDNANSGAEADAQRGFGEVVAGEQEDQASASPKVEWDRPYTDEEKLAAAMSGQVRQKDRISPPENTDTRPYQPRENVDDMPAEEAVQRLVNDSVAEDHEISTAEYIKSKQGEQWHEIPEPIAVPEPIIDTNYDRGQVSDSLRDELAGGVDEIAREEEDPKPNDIHSEESQLEAAEQEELQSYPLYFDDGKVITIIKNQSWSMGDEIKVITSIRLGSDKNSLFIGFGGHSSEEKAIEEWKKDFEFSKLLGDGVYELERARIGDVENYKAPEKAAAKYQTRQVLPGEAAGVKNSYAAVEFNKSKLIAEEAHIPPVAVETTEVVDSVTEAAGDENARQVEQMRGEIAKAVEAVPGSGEAVVAEEQREENEGEETLSEPQTPQQVHAKVLAGDNPDQADTGFATTIEDQIEAAQSKGETPVE